MILWRISNHENLGGRGGLRAAGRWHLAGFPVVYLSESSVGAVLEVCTCTCGADAPPALKLLKVVGPNLSLEEIPESALPGGWQEKQNLTRKLGTAWLEGGKTALLKVPSVLAPETANYLLNPLHPRAELFRVDRRYDYPFEAGGRG
jgi:RES domain-containing protein